MMIKKILGEKFSKYEYSIKTVLIKQSRAKLKYEKSYLRKYNTKVSNLIKKT